jgi:hypothetical protein
MALKQVDTDAVVADMIAIIGSKVFPAIEAELGGMAISADARHWWVNHYTRTFFFAQVVLEQVWADDEKQVLIKAGELGRKARAAAELAGHTEVEAEDAKLASMHVDCGVWHQSGTSPIRLFFKWC